MKLVIEDLRLPGICPEQLAALEQLVGGLEPFDAGDAARLYYASTGSVADLARTLMAVCVARRIDPNPWLDAIATAVQSAEESAAVEADAAVAMVRAARADARAAKAAAKRAAASAASAATEASAAGMETAIVDILLGAIDALS